MSHSLTEKYGFVSPLYPLGVIADMEILRGTLIAQRRTWVSYAEAKELIIDSYATYNQKPPKRHATNLATQYIREQDLPDDIAKMIADDTTTDLDHIKSFIKSFSVDVPKLRKVTDCGYVLHIRLTDKTADIAVLKNNKPIFGQCTPIISK